MAAVTAYSKVSHNDYEKVIPLAQTGAGITPINRYVDDGDIPAKIVALQVAAGIPANQRNTGLMDRKDWERMLVSVQGKLNAKSPITVSVANPAVVTAATHGFAIGQAFTFSTTGALPTGITAGTTYYVATPGFGAGAFQFSATKGGASVITTGTQSGVHSIYAV